MSVIKRAMASLSLGAATVDAIINPPDLTPGQTLTFTINVRGGKVEQQVDRIDLQLRCQFDTDPTDDDAEFKTYTLNEWSLPDAFVLAAGEERVFSSELTLPFNTPITLGEEQVWLETELDIAFAIDPDDKDLLMVRPDPYLAAILDLLDQQGLQLRQVDCEAISGFTLPFVQVLHFVPVSGAMLGKCRKLQTIYWRDENTVRFWFEKEEHLEAIEQRLTRLVQTDEAKHHIELATLNTPVQVAQQVAEMISRVL